MAKTGLNKFIGITDLIFSGNVNQAEIMDNFDITKEGKMIVRNGSRLYKIGAEQTLNELEVHNFFILDDVLFANSFNRIYYYDNEIWNELKNPMLEAAFSSIVIPSKTSFAKWNGHIISAPDTGEPPIKIYRDENDDFQTVQAGLPQLASDPTITPDADDSKNYIYRFIYKWDYTVGDLNFSDFGPIREVTVTSAGDMVSGVGHYNQITSIPSIPGTRHDITNIVCQIYRTTHNGTVFYYVNEVEYGTTTFQDTVTDTVLQTRELLYTEGGVYSNDTPPEAEFVIVANDIAWYLNVTEDDNKFDYRIRQSIKGDIDSCPASFLTDVDYEIKGGGSVGIKPIVMTTSKIYRLDGYVDQTGRGYTEAVVIDDVAGCLSHDSIVQSSKGLYWAGNDGFYFTDGYRVDKISDHINSTYKEFTSTVGNISRLASAYNPIENRIYWQTSTSSTSRKIYVLHEDWINRDEQGKLVGAFTTYSGGTHFNPSALIVENGILIRGSTLGYIYKHENNAYTDPNLTSQILPSSYNTDTIIHRWKHIAFDYNEPENNKWVSKVLTGFQSESNVHIQLKSYDDGSLVPVDLKEIVNVSDMTWGSPDFIWGSADHIWGEKKMFAKNRWMIKGNLRTRYKQLEITNALSTLDWSQQRSTANYEAATGKFTLTDTDLQWLDECEGYEIRASTDAGATYSDWYEIIDRVSDTVIDTMYPNIGDQTDMWWEIRGYSKTERPHIDFIGYEYEILGDKTKNSYYQSSEELGN